MYQSYIKRLPRPRDSARGTRVRPSKLARSGEPPTPETQTSPYSRQ